MELTSSEKAWFWIIQCTWGIIQTIIGAIVLLVLIASNDCEWRWHRGAIVTNIKNGSTSGSAATFGPFINYFFGYTDTIVDHEYGHCIQSLILGPLWILVIGLPSLLWCVLGDEYREANDYGYYDFYTEKWASQLGEWVKNRKTKGEENDDASAT